MNSAHYLKRSNGMNDYRSLLADLGAGTTLAFINAWDILLANAAVIVLRIVLEYLILKNNKRKEKNGND